MTAGLPNHDMVVKITNVSLAEQTSKLGWGIIDVFIFLKTESFQLQEVETTLHLWSDGKLNLLVIKKFNGVLCDLMG